MNRAGGGVDAVAVSSKTRDSIISMATPSPVRLLIADASQNRAHELDSILRNAGIATRPEFCSDLGNALAHASDRTPDLVLFTGEIDELDAILPGLRERQPELPIIVLTRGDEPSRLTHGMALGATDVVFENDRERLLHIIRRELHHVGQRHYLHATRRALDEAERRCQLLLANSTSPIAYVHEGMHIHANDDYLQLFGFESLDDLVGLPLLDLVDDGSVLKVHIKACREGSAELSAPFTGRTLSGDDIHGEITLTPAEYDGEPCTQVLVRQRARPAAGTPAPAAAANGSGVISGACSLEAFAERAAMAFDDDSGLTVITASVDEFHELQATHGLRNCEHLIADLERCLHSAADAAVVLRIGEHTFAIGGASSQSADDMLTENVRKHVEQSVFDIDGETVRCTVTLGAINVDRCDQVLAGLDLAFRAMVNGRLDGKPNAIHWYQSEPDTAVGAGAPDADREAMLARIHDAIEHDRFRLLYQPTISLRGDSDEHYEVFLRMLDEHGNQIRPDHFLQIAIDSGAALKIDRWVILQAIKELSSHRANGHDTRLTVNLTSNSLRDAEFGEWLGVAIKAARLPSDAMTFQISEPDAAQYVHQARSFVEGLNSLHCRTAMAHFGTSTTAFDTLKHVPVDIVKLDGALLQNIDQDSERRNALTQMISRLQALGKLTVVPMVESAVELSALWQAGANYIQGNYLQEPSANMSYDFSSDD
jgi:multidomain signaling protein FimX